MVQPSHLTGKSDAAAELLTHALDYRRRGLSVIPVKGKKAAGLWTPFQTEPADEFTLLRMFAKAGVTGVAVITGDVSRGLACRDFDRADAYHAWAEDYPVDAAALPTARTARGFHVFGRLADELFHDFGPGDGELRAGAGHYCVLPPSRHPSGVVYEWLTPLPADLAALPMLPSSLLPSVRTAPPLPPQPTKPNTHTACAPSGNITEEIQAAIEATLPADFGQRNRHVFLFARRLRTLGLEAGELKAIVAEWHRQALPNIRTKEFAETWTDFQTSWLNIKAPFRTSLDSAFATARQQPLPAIDGSDELGALAALCRNLARADGTFFLSCRTVAGLFGVSAITGHRWLKALAFYEVITLVKKGTKRDAQASQWRYTGRPSRGE